MIDGLLLLAPAVILYGFWRLRHAGGPRRLKRFERGKAVLVPFQMADVINIARDERCGYEPIGGWHMSVRFRPGSPPEPRTWVLTCEPADEFFDALAAALTECNRSVHGMRLIHVHQWERRHVAPMLLIGESDYAILEAALGAVSERARR